VKAALGHGNKSNMSHKWTSLYCLQVTLLHHSTVNAWGTCNIASPARRKKTDSAQLVPVFCQHSIYVFVIVGALPEFWKATITVVMSVCLSVRMEQLGSHLTDFHEIRYLIIFRKFVETIQILLNSGKNNGYFTCRPMYIYDNISLNSS
jgi:hypothetical protein